MRRGQQRVWNRQCVLTAWSTWIIASAWGAFKDVPFNKFMEQYAPPGYDPNA